MTRPDSVSPSSTPPPPLPRTGHLYLLLVGVLLGLVLGPAVLGRVSPGVYRGWFQGGRDAVSNVLDYQRETAAQEAKLRRVFGSGGGEDSSAEAAILSLRLKRDQGEAQRRLTVTQAEDARLARVRGWMLGLVLAVAGVMAIEAVLAPPTNPTPAPAPPPTADSTPNPADTDQSPPHATLPIDSITAGMVTARYTLLAAWVMLALAQPGVLSGGWSMTAAWATAGVVLVVGAVVATAMCREHLGHPKAPRTK